MREKSDEKKTAKYRGKNVRYKVGLNFAFLFSRLQPFFRNSINIGGDLTTRDLASHKISMYLEIHCVLMSIKASNNKLSPLQAVVGVLFLVIGGLNINNDEYHRQAVNLETNS